MRTRSLRPQETQTRCRRLQLYIYNALIFIGTTRVARIGICLSVLLPILCCEFLYLNLVAVPAYHTKVWTTTLEAQSELPSPSFALVGLLLSNGEPFVNTTANCTAGGYVGLVGCLGPPQKATLAVFGGVQYQIYDASKMSYNISITGTMHVPANVTCRFASNQRPTSALTRP